MGWVVPELEEVKRPVNRKVRGIKPTIKAVRIASHQGIDTVAA
jgi:phosphotransferase system IIA component